MTTTELIERLKFLLESKKSPDHLVEADVVVDIDDLDIWHDVEDVVIAYDDWTNKYCIVLKVVTE